jgi:hypothetical protein
MKKLRFHGGYEPPSEWIRYRVKDEKTRLSVSCERLKCATDKYEIQILETAGTTVFPMRVATNYARALELTESFSGGAVLSGLDWED